MASLSKFHTENDHLSQLMPTPPISPCLGPDLLVGGMSHISSAMDRADSNALLTPCSCPEGIELAAMFKSTSQARESGTTDMRMAAMFTQRIPEAGRREASDTRAPAMFKSILRAREREAK
jgi:hypothetical protein